MQEPQEIPVWSLGGEDPLEECMATHSSVLARRIPWTEEPGRLQSIGSQSFRHDWSNLAHMHTWSQLCLFIHRWTLRLFPCLGYCKWCYCEHGGADIFRVSVYISFVYIPRNGIARSYGSSFFFFKPSCMWLQWCIGKCVFHIGLCPRAVLYSVVVASFKLTNSSVALVTF